MGLIYRKRVNTDSTGRLRSWLNLSRSGVSASARAGRVTVNSRGRISVRLLRGLSWRAGR